MRKVLITLNLWGRFYCRHMNRVFDPAKAPTGHELRAVYEAYHTAIGGVTRESNPLSPDELNKKQNKFEDSTFNWLFLSVWLGLRPKEIDSLKDPECFRFEEDKRKMPLLKIYQTKLINVPPDKRWKTIPRIYPEQKKCKAIVESSEFRRPLTRRVSKHLGDRIKLNAGRKGFVDLMISRGQDIFDISQWLGHWTVKRTWFDYKNRNEVHYCLPESGKRI